MQLIDTPYNATFRVARQHDILYCIRKHNSISQKDMVVCTIFAVHLLLHEVKIDEPKDTITVGQDVLVPSDHIVDIVTFDIFVENQCVYRTW